jgi:hypothetical protein
MCDEMVTGVPPVGPIPRQEARSRSRLAPGAAKCLWLGHNIGACVLARCMDSKLSEKPGGGPSREVGMGNPAEETTVTGPDRCPKAGGACQSLAGRNTGGHGQGCPANGWHKNLIIYVKAFTS